MHGGAADRAGNGELSPADARCDNASTTRRRGTTMPRAGPGRGVERSGGCPASRWLLVAPTGPSRRARWGLASSVHLARGASSPSLRRPVAPSRSRNDDPRNDFGNSSRGAGGRCSMATIAGPASAVLIASLLTFASRRRSDEAPRRASRSERRTGERSTGPTRKHTARFRAAHGDHSGYEHR